MKKVVFFTDTECTALQLKVNDWLSVNKNIDIIHTNLNTVIDISGSIKYTFYILYTIINHDAMEIDQLIQQHTNADVSISEIKTDLLNSSN